LVAARNKFLHLHRLWYCKKTRRNRLDEAIPDMLLKILSNDVIGNKKNLKGLEDVFILFEQGQTGERKKNLD